MKKLMIAAAIVCATACANAATIGWACVTPASLIGNDYRFFIVGQGGDKDHIATSVKYITDMIYDGKDVTAYSFSGDRQVLTQTATLGKMTIAAKDSGKILEPEATTKYQGFFIVYNNAEWAKATEFALITSAQNAQMDQTIGGSTASANFAAANQSSYLTKTATVNNWRVIPEPTSALLMLLGVAGLALKRRRA